VKKVSKCKILLGLLLVVSLVSFLNAATMKLVDSTDTSSQTITVNVGSTFSVDVWVVSNTDNVNAAGVYLDYSSSYFTYQSNTPTTSIFGDTLEQFGTSTSFNYAAMTTADSTNISEFRLVTLTFLATSVGTTNITFYTADDTSNRQSALVRVSDASNVASSYLNCTVVVQSVSDTSHIVISEACYTWSAASDEFVELYNPRSDTVNISGWSLKRKTATGTESNLKTIGTAYIRPKGYYLIASTSYTGSVTPDTTYTAALAAKNSLLLYDTTSTVIDKVGYGAVVDSEVASCTDPGTGKSIERKANALSTVESMMTGSDSLAGNAYDSDNNYNDFIVRTTPDPQNSNSDTEPRTAGGATTQDTTPPADIVWITATAGVGSATVAWQATTATDSYWYKVYYSTQPITVVSTAILAGTKACSAGDTSYYITSLTNGQIYYFAVTAIDTALNEDTYPSVTAYCTPTAAGGGAQTPLTITSAYHTITIDGSKDFNDTAEAVGSCTTPTDWGVNNDLDTLYFTYNADTIYIGVKGSFNATGSNFVLVYLDRDFGNTTGVSNMSSLTDNTGDPDNAISSVLNASSISGFGAELAMGWNPNGSVGGVRRFETPAKYSNFDWITNAQYSGNSSYVEFAIPVREVYNDTEIKGKQIALLACIANNDGGFLSNQYIPDSAIANQKIVLIKIDDNSDSVLDNYGAPTISGIIRLQANASGDSSGVNVWFYQYPGNTLITSCSTTVTGAFSMTVSNGITGYVRAKEFHHLAKNSATITVSGDTNIGTLDLLAGDADNNNKVNIFDAGNVKGKTGTTNSAADIDRSGTVNATDLNYIRTNFGVVGDSLK